MDKRYISHSPEETLGIARELAETLRADDVVLLYGELGAGKTVFARGIARGLGIEESIKSPTFTLLREYEGRLKLHHFDLYRLEDEDELFETGFSACLEGGVCVVEWPRVALDLLGAEVISVSIEYDGENRTITVTDGRKKA